jgi:hypothetical protein
MPTWLAVAIIGVLVVTAVAVWVPALRLIRRLGPSAGTAETRRED